MNIFFICPYGALPYENWSDYRYTILGKKLSEQNHKVCWLASSFSHHSKKQRYLENDKFNVDSNFSIKLINTSEYKSNISFKRVFFEFIYSKRVIKFLENEKNKIDMIIVCGLNFTYQRAACNYAYKKKIPIIIDVLDLYPEVFMNIFPDFLKTFINFLFKPFYWLRANDFKKLNGAVFCTKSFKDHCRDITSNYLKENSTVSYLCSSSSRLKLE